jgi:DNA polymerase III epsilon subunit-like protein
MANIFMGLDGEMTSADLDQGGKLIQIGLATGTEPEERITELIGWDRDDFFADPVAMAVHGIPEETIVAAPRAPEVDEKLHEWCLAHGGKPEKRKLVTVGWNVGAFDLPFVRHTLPKTFTLLSRRSADLNAICFALGDTVNMGGSRPAWTGFRRMSKRAAEKQLTKLGIDPAWHDAGYDALAGLLSFRWLREAVKQ